MKHKVMYEIVAKDSQRIRVSYINDADAGERLVAEHVNVPNVTSWKELRSAMFDILVEVGVRDGGAGSVMMSRSGRQENATVTMAWAASK